MAISCSPSLHPTTRTHTIEEPMVSGKRSRNSICAPTASPEIALTWALPVDLLLEIVACTDDVSTLLRCAATCKLLRREIQSPGFIRRLTQQSTVAPCILAHLGHSSKDKPLTLAHPATAAAASLCHDQLSAFMSRNAQEDDLLGQYSPVTSRRGLVVLMRRCTRWRPKSKRSSDLCVYDPMTGHRTFLPKPSGIRGNDEDMENYVLLTAEDGIACSFTLFVADLYKRTIYVQTAASSSCTWSAAATYPSHAEDFPWWSVRHYRAPAVLRGGIMHWLAYPGDQALTYDVGTRTMGKVKLPPTCKRDDGNQLHLATSSDGNLLKLIAIEGFTISVWLQDGDHRGWSLQNVTDIQNKLRSVLCPHIYLGVSADDPAADTVLFEGSGQRAGDVVLLYLSKSNVLLVHDLETNEMHTQEWGFTLLEIDLTSRLRAMKMFS